MTCQRQRSVAFGLLTILLAACSGGHGASSNSGPLPPAPQGPAGAPAASSYVTIQGPVVGITVTPDRHLNVKLANQKRVAIYTSYLPNVKVGATIEATGYYDSLGDFRAASAKLVDPSQAATPGVVAEATPTPVPPQVSAAGPSTLGRIGLFQIFDYNMSAAQARSAAAHDDFVWGSGIGGNGATSVSWNQGNPRIVNARYFVQGTDAGLSRHDLGWFKTHHPSWIVYDCDANNRPTRTVAHQPGLPDYTPLDITNPRAIAYQIHEVGTFAIAHGNNAIGADQTLFFDYDGGQHPGWFGCGVYRNGSFVRRWGASQGGFPNYDPRWSYDTAQWVKSAKRLLATDPTLAPHHLKLIVNHPAGNVNDPNERTLLQNVDAVLDEPGFSNYGKYAVSPASFFRTTLDYVEYAQSLGVSVLETDKFGGGNSVTKPQLSWAIATYLLGNEGKAELSVTPGPYGSEFYYPEYGTIHSRLGKPCGRYTVAGNGVLYMRRFSGGFVVVNSGGIGTISASLAAPSLSDLVGRHVSNPLLVKPYDSYVLLSPGNGC
ncbi:MAG TPA: hypothetical protein VIG51_12515 [Candidatus Baltobacteraceae bacterium]|jgi:hypothetical protein